MSGLTDRLRGIASKATPGPWELRAGPSVYMDGTGSYTIREEDVPGVRVTLTAQRQTAEHIGTFDPVLVGLMLDVIDAADAALVGPDASEQQAIERSDALVDALARFREVAG